MIAPSDNSVTIGKFLCGIVRHVNRCHGVELLLDVRLEFLPQTRGLGRE
jgi:hypothetical protein